MKIRDKDRKVFLIVITIVIIVLFFSGFSIGKEMNRTDIKAIAEVAKPILTIENGEKVNINNNNNKGTYEFAVKNYDENENINQVDLEYYVEILTNIDNNVRLKIYKDDVEITTQENKTPIYTMDKITKQEDKYKIEVICDEEKTLEQLIQEIQIKVHSEQKRV